MWLGGDRDPLWRAGPSWAFLSPLGLVAARRGEKGEPAGPGRGPCGPLSANAAVFSGVSGLRRGPSRISLPVGRFPAGFSPGLFSHFFPESPAGPFFSLRRPQGRVQGGRACTRASCGRPGHVPGRSAPSSAGVAPPSRFSPRRPGRGVLTPFALRAPQGRFSPPGGSQEVSWGERPAHGLPVGPWGLSRRPSGPARAPFCALSLGPRFFCTPLIKVRAPA